MLKIGKGLHKKKKSKKNKNKEEELFTEEELVQYRKERGQRSEEDSELNSGEKKTLSEDFEKFKALTAGVDDILKKSQGDLDRIKKESFFQRKPTPSELKAQEEKEKNDLKQTQGNWIDFEDQKEESFQLADTEKEKEESASEEEFDYENDDIFDTAYVEALESGEVKLAYVPEDDEVIEVDETDPFDTTSAEEILKKVTEEEIKKKQQISLGLAVKVLTGRAERDKSLLKETGIEADLDEDIAVGKPRKRPRKIQDIVLIGSFDEESPLPHSFNQDQTVTQAPVSLLDNDDTDVDIRVPEGDELISEYLLAQKEAAKTEQTESEKQTGESNQSLQDVVLEFDVINEKFLPEVRKAEEVEDQFDEFTALATSSVANQKLEEELQKFEDLNDDPFDTSTVDIVLKEQSDPFGNIDSDIPLPQISELSLSNKWAAFESTENQEESEIDPFDTTFVEKITPGKCELKLLEKEILGNLIEAAHKSDVHQEARILSRNNSETDYHQTRSEIELPNYKKPNPHSSVSIQITDPSGFVETQRDLENELEGESFVRSLSYKYRDLLGGSTTDLTKVCTDPLPPEIEAPAEEFPAYSDPFDTSIVAGLTLPGKAELKFLERELLSDIEKVEDKDSLSDENFDVRGEEISEKKVSFQVPSSDEGILLSPKDPKEIRPLTPYRSDEAGDAESPLNDFEDPFDTSHLTTLPGKEELKIIEKELNDLRICESSSESVFKKLGISEDPQGTETTVNHHFLKGDLDPGQKADDVKTFAAEFSRFQPAEPKIFKGIPDPLVVEEDISAKALTPEVEEDISSYIDPFDTSIAENILPGKAELKVLESELIGESQPQVTIKRSYTDPDFDPRNEPKANPDLEIIGILKEPQDLSLNVETLNSSDFNSESNTELDPFDTSMATNLILGKGELSVVESELFGQ